VPGTAPEARRFGADIAGALAHRRAHAFRNISQGFRNPVRDGVADLAGIRGHQRRKLCQRP
jgi:hypothetical protein